jgi:hypothetical protein
MVWRSMPVYYQHYPFPHLCSTHQLVKKVILSVDMIQILSYTYQHANMQGKGHQEAALSFRWNYPDQV